MNAYLIQLRHQLIPCVDIHKISDCSRILVQMLVVIGYVTGH